MQDFNSELDQLLLTELAPLEPMPTGKYVVYGAGNIGKEVAVKLARSGRTVSAFLDVRATGLIDGIPIYSPGSTSALQLAGEGMPVVIGIFNSAVDPMPVQILLDKLGFRRIINFLEFQEHFDLKSHFWLTLRRHVLDSKAQVRAAFKLLSDDKSRRVFLDAIRLRLAHDSALLRNPDLEQQYLPDDLPRPEMPLRLIDGGAFTGDTLEFFLHKGATFEAVAAFEPDPENFRKLCATVHTNALGDVVLWPCGISDTTQVASFHAGRGLGSVVVADGNMHIQLVALDEIMPSFRPNYIKLDIEGSELAALQGGAEMIQKHQPALAVCVYHHPDHLWTIPLYLRELLPLHRISLRYYAFNAFELVVYAMPVISA
ncbi:MAG: FkbM family methyltransferase [Chthoniobacteraceae bacterium]